MLLADISYGAFQPPGAHGACLGMFPTFLGVFLALWVRPDPSYTLYFQPRDTYFLAQCQGLFGGAVGRCWEAQLAMTALLLALLAYCLRHDTIGGNQAIEAT